MQATQTPLLKRGFAYTYSCWVQKMSKHDSLDFLIQQLKSSNVGERRFALYCLGEMGEAAAPAVPFLMQALDNYTLDLCALTIIALGKIGPKAASACPVLIDLLEEKIIDEGHGGTGIPSRASEALVSIGVAAIPYLLDALKDGFWVSLKVKPLIPLIGEKAVPALISAAREERISRGDLAEVMRELQQNLRKQGLSKGVVKTPRRNPPGVGARLAA